MNRNAFCIIVNLLMALPLSLVAAQSEIMQTSTSSPPVTVQIPAANGLVSGYMQATAIPGFFGKTVKAVARIQTIYVPETGAIWVGYTNEARLAFVDGALIGFDYFSPLARLNPFVSTNRQAARIADINSVLHAELAAFTNSSRRFDPRFRHEVELMTLLGEETVFGGWETNALGEITTFHAYPRKSKLEAVTVEGTNVVVTVSFSTNVIARLAFDKYIRPKWATTNGVSIGTIPTNTVIYIDAISNRRAIKQVY